MSLPPLFRKYLSVLESSVTGRDSEELLSLREWVREAAAADNRPEKVQTLAGIGIACTYGSHTAGVWIGYIRDPSSVSPASVGRIPCCPGRGDYSSLFTVKEPVLRPELSVSNIGSGYAAAFSTCCMRPPKPLPGTSATTMWRCWMPPFIGACRNTPGRGCSPSQMNSSVVWMHAAKDGNVPPEYCTYLINSCQYHFSRGLRWTHPFPCICHAHPGHRRRTRDKNRREAPDNRLKTDSRPRSPGRDYNELNVRAYMISSVTTLYIPS